MGSNRFYISLVVNCLLIFATAFLFFYFLQVREQPNTAVGIAIMALLLTFRLIYHVNRTNRILGNFLSYMHEKDPSLHYSKAFTEKNFRGLNEALENLIREFKENRIELEVQAHYLEAILNNVSTGILCFNEHAQVSIMNQSALNYLNISKVKHLDEINRKHPGLGNRIRGMGIDDQLTEFLRIRGGVTYLNLQSTQIKLKKESIFIVAINDITHQMEEQEILSWKKLIRVINHEIMNSMTPIITLAMAIRKKLSSREGTTQKIERTEAALIDATQSASIIEERSRALIQFIERYKKLTGLPPMKLEHFPTGSLFKKIDQLFRAELEDKGISLSWPADCNIELVADRQMLEQVLINLIKNALEATRHTKDPEIILSCSPEGDKHIHLSVSDNGEGIPKDKLEQVFIPFFTTRADGSGIGLSLCRQIIRSHQGKMHIESEPGKGTRVLIILMRDQNA